MASTGQIRRGHCRRGHATTEYRGWAHMLDRILNPNSRGWHNYGGRGLTVDPRWRSLEAFLADLGPRPTPELTLERIDNMQGYWPGNVAWAPHATQAQNRRASGRQKLARQQAAALKADPRPSPILAKAYGASYPLARQIKTGHAHKYL